MTQSIANIKKNNKLPHQIKSNTSIWNSIKKDRLRYLLILPGLIFFIVYKYVPIYGLLAAFKDYRLADGIWNSKWNDFYHFKTMFLYGDFQRALRNALIISFMKIFFGFLCTIILALLVNELREGMFKKIAQTISYLPNFMSWVVVYGFFLYMFSSNTGVVTKVFATLGLSMPDLFNDPGLFRWTLTISNIWKSVGWGTIVYIAALAAIDPQLHEAAIIDGASKLQRIWHISLAGILPMIILMLILNIGGVLYENLEQILQFYNPIVRPISEVFETIVYEKGIRDMNYGYTTAVGLFQSIVGLVLTLAADKTSKKLGQDGLW